MIGAGVCFSTAMTAFRYTAGLRGPANGELDDEEVERREAHKKLRRRPLSETLEQLGEGRGMHFKPSSVIWANFMQVSTALVGRREGDRGL